MQQWCMLQIPLFWGTVLFTGFLRFQDNIASKLQEAIIQWSSVTSQKNRISSYTTAKTWCIWHSVYVHCQKLHYRFHQYIFTMVRNREQSAQMEADRLCVRHFTCLYEDIPCSVFHTALLPFRIFSTQVERHTPVWECIYICVHIFQIYFITHLYLTSLSLYSLLM